MIDWVALIGETKTDEEADNCPESGELPHTLGSDSEKVGKPKTNNDKGLKEISPLSPLSPLLFEGIGNRQENNSSREGVSSDNFRDAKTYSVNPIAICLLLTCCNKATVNKEETLGAIMKLQTIPQPEQIRSWAILCHDYGIDPFSIIYPFTQSPGKGTDCQGCQHFDMQLIQKPNERKQYHWTCNKSHSTLEAHSVGGRTLIAPAECKDYSPA